MRLSLNLRPGSEVQIKGGGRGQNSETSVAILHRSQAGLETERTDISNNNMHNNVNARMTGSLLTCASCGSADV